MGRPVVHFEIMGTDAAALRAFYGGLFGWSIEADNPLGYGTVLREDNLNRDGIGIGGGIGAISAGHPGYVTVYVEVPDVEAALQQAERLGGRRLMGPEAPMAGLEIGLLSDPEGHVVGLVRAAG